MVMRKLTGITYLMKENSKAVCEMCKVMNAS
jgi:hypothetical protein